MEERAVVRADEPRLLVDLSGQIGARGVLGEALGGLQEEAVALLVVGHGAGELALQAPRGDRLPALGAQTRQAPPARPGCRSARRARDRRYRWRIALAEEGEHLGELGARRRREAAGVVGDRGEGLGRVEDGGIRAERPRALDDGAPHVGLLGVDVEGVERHLQGARRAAEADGHEARLASDGEEALGVLLAVGGVDDRVAEGGGVLPALGLDVDVEEDARGLLVVRIRGDGHLPRRQRARPVSERELDVAQLDVELRLGPRRLGGLGAPSEELRDAWHVAGVPRLRGERAPRGGVGRISGDGLLEVSARDGSWGRRS